MKNILVAIDFSNATPGVIAMASSLAKSFGANLNLIHIIEVEPSYSAYGFTPDEFPAMNAFQEEAKRRASTKLDELLTKVKTELPSATAQISEGSPLHSILDYIQQINADFVVVGSHGHGIIASLLLGSVAEGLVRKAHVPTLVVPAALE